MIRRMDHDAINERCARDLLAWLDQQASNSIVLGRIPDPRSVELAPTTESAEVVTPANRADE